jgi:hypothetical protein
MFRSQKTRVHSVIAFQNTLIFGSGHRTTPTNGAEGISESTSHRILSFFSSFPFSYHNVYSRMVLNF